MEVLFQVTSHIPHNDNDKIQQVPAAADVGAGMHDQTVREDLCECFDCENDQKHILHLFLGIIKVVSTREIKYL